MAEQGNGLDKRIASLPAKKKLDALIDAPNAQALVRRMPAEELYYAIVEVGLEDATEIVQLASPSQFRTFVDLGAWKRDRIDPHAVLTWLRAARGDDEDAFQKKLEKLDFEVFEFMLRSFLTIHDLEENPHVNPEGVTVETPEGKYLIEIRAEGAELAALRLLINDLMAKNAFEAVRLFEALRWEIPSELEETAFRFRSARLEDLGFPPLEEAVALFAWRDPDKVPPIQDAPAGEGPTPPAQVLVRAGERVNYLEVALRGLDDVERDNFDVELRALANAALVAEIQDPGDLDAVRRVGEMVRDYLSLGIEHLTRGEPRRAPDCVREVEAKKIFQVGFSLTLKLKFKVDRLAREPLTRLGEVWLALPFEANTLSALRRKRPLRALEVEGAEPVPFRSRQELEEAASVVARAAAQAHLFRALLGGAEEEARRRLASFAQPFEVLGPERLLNAVVGHVVLDGAPRIAPVPLSRVAALCGRLFEGSAGAPAIRAEAAGTVRTVLTSLVDEPDRPAIVSTVDSVLETLREELARPWLEHGRWEPSLSEILPTTEDQAL